MKKKVYDITHKEREKKLNFEREAEYDLICHKRKNVRSCYNVNKWHKEGKKENMQEMKKV